MKFLSFFQGEIRCDSCNVSQTLESYLCHVADFKIHFRIHYDTLVFHFGLHLSGQIFEAA